MGKLKGKIVKSGDSGCLKVKQDDGSSILYNYNQPFSKALGIVDGATCTFELVPIGDKAVMATCVNPVDKGDIVSIDYDTNTGTILEKESGIRYPFTQPFLRERGFAMGDTVKYTIVTVEERNLATCLVKPAN
jgi:hypothetical protein